MLQLPAHLVVILVVHDPRLQHTSQRHLASDSPLGVSQGEVGANGPDGQLLETAPAVKHQPVKLAQT